MSFQFESTPLAGLSYGPDGNIWATEFQGDLIAIDPISGHILQRYSCPREFQSTAACYFNGTIGFGPDPFFGPNPALFTMLFVNDPTSIPNPSSYLIEYSLPLPNNNRLSIQLSYYFNVLDTPVTEIFPVVLDKQGTLYFAANSATLNHAPVIIKEPNPPYGMFATLPANVYGATTMAYRHISALDCSCDFKPNPLLNQLYLNGNNCPLQAVQGGESEAMLIMTGPWVASDHGVKREWRRDGQRCGPGIAIPAARFHNYFESWVRGLVRWRPPYRRSNGNQCNRAVVGERWAILCCGTRYGSGYKSQR